VSHLKLIIGLGSSLVVLSSACSDLLGLENGIEAARNCTTVKECGPEQICHEHYCLHTCKVDDECESGERCDGDACIPTGDRCLVDQKKCDGLQPLRCSEKEKWIESGDACDIACKAGTCFTPNSCLPSPKCGADAVPCCASDVLPDATFELAYIINPDEPATATRTVRSVALDRYEVSLGRFRVFIGAYDDARKPREDAGKLPDLPGSGWHREWSEDPELMPVSKESLIAGIAACGPLLDSEKSDVPVRCVNWYVALAFCIWDGGRLPTEAEWAFAAGNGDEQRYYPWSDPADSEAIEQSDACFHDETHDWNGPLPIGDRPLGAGKFGHQDLAGNVAEWLYDSYGERLSNDDCLARSGEHTAPADCIKLVSDLRVMRGGSFVDWPESLTNRVRSNSLPGMRDPTLGFRCARDFD
jgi:sulfatase modifying factor 1